MSAVSSQELPHPKSCRSQSRRITDQKIDNDVLFDLAGALVNIISHRATEMGLIIAMENKRPARSITFAVSTKAVSYFALAAGDHA